MNSKQKSLPQDQGSKAQPKTAPGRLVPNWTTLPIARSECLVSSMLCTKGGGGHQGEPHTWRERNRGRKQDGKSCWALAELRAVRGSVQTARVFSSGHSSAHTQHTHPGAYIRALWLPVLLSSVTALRFSYNGYRYFVCMCARVSYACLVRTEVRGGHGISCD